MNYIENKKAHEVVNGCLTYIVLIILATFVWAFIFFMVYDLILPTWVSDLPPVTMWEKILIGFVWTAITARLRIKQ